MKIGFLGTGLMGQPMALKLLQEGYSLTAYNRTQSKLQPVAEAGGAIANSATEVIQQSDCIILMLTDAAAIEAWVLAAEAQQYLSGENYYSNGNDRTD